MQKADVFIPFPYGDILLFFALQYIMKPKLSRCCTDKKNTFKDFTFDLTNRDGHISQLFDIL